MSLSDIRPYAKLMGVHLHAGVTLFGALWHMVRETLQLSDEDTMAIMYSRLAPAGLSHTRQ